MIGKIRMLLYKFIDQRHHIIIAYRYCTVILNIFVFYFPVLIQNKAGSISVPIHIMIIAHVILRQYKRNLPLGKHDLSAAHGAVLIHCSHIVRTYHYIALVIHDLNDLVELVYGCHNLIITA